MAKKKKKARKITARNWGVVALICRSGGKGKHQLKKHPARSTTKAALKKSLMRNNPHEAFYFFKTREWKKRKPNARLFFRGHSLLRQAWPF